MQLLKKVNRLPRKEKKKLKKQALMFGLRGKLKVAFVEGKAYCYSEQNLKNVIINATLKNSK